MNKYVQTTLGLLVICGIVFAAYFLIKEVWSIFKSIDPQLSAGIIAASATVLVSVFTVMFSKRQEHKVDIENQIRSKKIPVYEKIIEFIFQITFAEKLGKKQPSEKEMVKFFADTTRDLVIWGSQDMVSAFGDFKVGLAELESNNDPAYVLSIVEDLLIALRKDLGHKQKDIKRGDILRLYINDIPDYFPQT
ncbi:MULTISPECIES: hypothetical protein [Shewanella]|uniref:hypothetical protein n=1 Tax=Shewanella TaxID=22 RepID=UPI001C660E2B|nr:MULTISPECIES: hypothetical protein [Shewanella]MDH0447474.1 hypothetical protein [Shewanella sp. GD04112]QYK10006.1 hypothetical protein K0H60_04675 [Shewanella mangrovisoli]